MNNWGNNCVFNNVYLTLMKFLMNIIKKILMLNGYWIGSRYILKELIFPFIFSISVVTFVLLLNFLIKSVDRLLGKELPVGIILEFIYLNMAWIIAMSVPMAVLVACLMAYGRLAEDNEITAMRASGISFLSILGPGILFGVLITISMLHFHNKILPNYNHRARLLSGDIYRKRPGLNIEPGFFMDDIPDYSIYVKEKKHETLKKLTIYNKTTTQSETQSTIYADSGIIKISGNTILFSLYSGEIHELNLKNLEDYRLTKFEKHIVTIPVDNMMLERRDKSRRGDREMSIPMMKTRVEKYSKSRDECRKKILNLIQKHFEIEEIPDNKTLQKLIDVKKKLNKEKLSEAEAKRENRLLTGLQKRIRSEKNLAASYQRQVNKYNVEIQKKYSMPFACIVFVLIGAPLGILTNKGGIPLAATVSIFFFLVYYVFLIGGEELADLVIIPPFWAMWSPNILLFTIGNYLVYLTTWGHQSINFSLFTKKK